MDIDIKTKVMVEKLSEQGAILVPTITFIVTKIGEEDEPPCKKMRIY